MDCVILVDNSNLFIEGQKVSALRKGVRPAPGTDRQPADVSWRINFEQLQGPRQWPNHSSGHPSRLSTTSERLSLEDGRAGRVQGDHA
jgi:hypothetical protein